jgi:hypothetical protein
MNTVIPAKGGIHGGVGPGLRRDDEEGASVPLATAALPAKL